MIQTTAVPLEHLQHSISPPGSTLYYALRQLPEAQRAPCLGLFGLYREFQALVFSRSETNYVQFGWWYQELDRLQRGLPRHPLTRALAGWPECSPPRPLDWLTGLESSLGLTTFKDENQLLDLCSVLGGPLFRALRGISGGTVEGADGFTRDAGIAYTLFGFIENLGRHLRRGVVPIPQTELDLLQLSSADLLRTRHSPAYLNLMEIQYQRVSGMLFNVSSTLPEKRGSGLVAARIIAMINRAVLEEIRRNGFDVVDNYIDITPLRKAWIARSTSHQTMQ